MKKLKLLIALLLTLNYVKVFAANQMREQLSPEVQAGLHSSIINPIRPHLVFANKKLADVWLMNTSMRLRKWVPDDFLRNRYLTIIQYEATRAGLDPQIILSIITIEARFNKYAIGSSGERGMMQVMPFWLDQIGKPNQDLFDVQTNIRYGCTILRYYLQKEHGNLTRALARYNGAIKLSNYAGYPDKVFSAYNKYWALNYPNTLNNKFANNSKF
ncbi:MAG: transglycosylase SLT domain-containing protein [Burkholderiales bacterium]|nr:transglycosylase SLT domain-containing protein [Burkholderiales bacterium]